MSGKSNLVALKVRCRRCAACLRYRSAIWRVRAEAEIKAAPRTWMGTLTLSPGAHQYFLDRARVRWKARGNGDFDKEGAWSQFRERHREISSDITKFVKRLREKHKGKLRFLLVVEAHKSGLPHYHMLVHEDGTPLRYAALRSEWPHGFTKWKLCDPKAAAYVCKYLTKSSQARVRASLGYGDPTADAVSPHALSVGTSIVPWKNKTPENERGHKSPVF